MGPTVMFQQLYGKKAAALYTQAGDYQKTARFYYKKAEDTYYQANNWAAYDDWRRARPVGLLLLPQPVNDDTFRVWVLVVWSGGGAGVPAVRGPGSCGDGVASVSPGAARGHTLFLAGRGYIGVGRPVNGWRLVNGLRLKK